MNGATLVIEFHGYRGLGRVGGPLGTALTLGFITVFYIPFLLTEWLRARTSGMVNALKRRRFPEMDAFGEKD